MAYKSLNDCVLDLEKNGMLFRIKEEVDPYLEMSAIHQLVFKKYKKAVLFENVKGSNFRALSNIFGTLEQSKYIFRKNIKPVKGLVALKGDPTNIIKKPFSFIDAIATRFH